MKEVASRHAALLDAPVPRPALKRPPPHLGQCIAWDFDGPVTRRHRPEFAGCRQRRE